MNDQIKIDMSGYCKNCKFADLYLEKEHNRGFVLDTVNHILHCKHEQVCEFWNSIRKSESISSALNTVDALNVVNEGYLVSYDELKRYKEEQ